MKTSILALPFLLFILLYSIGAWAKNIYTLSHSLLNTSSLYHSRVFNLSTAFNDQNISLEAKKTDGYVEGVDFNVRSVNLGYKFQGLRTKPVLKLGYFNREYASRHLAVGLYQISGEETINEKLYYSYQVGYIPMSEEFQTAYTVREILRGGNITIGGSYRLSDSWRTTFYLQHFTFNDKNTRNNDDLALMYGIAPGDPWFWLGFGASRMSNTNTNLPYWVPLEFYTLGPRFDLAFTLSDKFRLASGLNLNYFKDVKVGEGRGYYSMTKIFYKIFPSIDLYSSLESIQSQQLGKTWKSSALSFGINGTW